jgi:putative flippase GtrA
VETVRASLIRVPAPLRYLAAAGVNTLIYVGLTLLLVGIGGVPIQAAIPIAYVTAMCTHFLLQRLVVFAHVDSYALRGHQQAGRYLAIAAVQYPATAVITAVIPELTGWSERLVYVVTVIVIAALTFLLLRERVFHPSRASSFPRQDHERPAEGD